MGLNCYFPIFVDEVKCWNQISMILNKIQTLNNMKICVIICRNNMFQRCLYLLKNEQNIRNILHGRVGVHTREKLTGNKKIYIYNFARNFLINNLNIEMIFFILIPKVITR